MTNALNAAITEAVPLALDSANGYVVVSAVTNYGSTFTVSQQYFKGSLSGAKSVVGPSYAGTNKFNQANLPNKTMLPAHRTVYVAEIYYRFTPITPVGNFFKAALPTQFYDVAYFSAL
jgi:O-glycosyl hydrolase